MITGSSGYRNVGSGAIAFEGSLGYYWSASPYSAASGLDLYFLSGIVGPQYNFSRGGGFPLRCIREFTLHGENRWNGRKRKRRGKKVLQSETQRTWIRKSV